MVYNIFLDTNILADHILDRNEDSSKIIKLCEASKIRGFASSASFFTLAYLIEDKLKLKAHPILSGFNKFIDTLPTYQSNLEHAYLSSFKDLEDAFQYFTALNEKSVNYFITNNKKDFKSVTTKLKVLSSKDFISNYSAVYEN